MPSTKLIAIFSAMFIAVIVLSVFPLMNQSVRAEQTKYFRTQKQTLSFQDIKHITTKYRLNIQSMTSMKRYFGNDVIEKALAIPGSVDVRAYYGKDQNGKGRFLFYGVDRNGYETLATIAPPPCPKCGG